MDYVRGPVFPKVKVDCVARDQLSPETAVPIG